MTSSEIRLHSKLYRARAIDEAIDAVLTSFSDGITARRTRDGEYYVVEASGIAGEDATELLADIADAALILTVEKDH